MGAIAGGHIDYLHWEPETIAVRLQGACAVIRYRAILEVIFGGHRVPLSAYWHTDTHERRDGQWIVTWSQATAVQSGAAILPAMRLHRRKSQGPFSFRLAAQPRDQSVSRSVRRLETTRRFCTLQERSVQSRTSRSLP